MLDFWAGPRDQERAATASARPRGTVTSSIAVDWQQPHQFTYDYSAREHHAVLGALRDACRRFSIDTDRVFLTGHGIGGDAAWDIAHRPPRCLGRRDPDRRRGRHVTSAAMPRTRQYVPWYFVAGELDGDKMAHNAVELDRYHASRTPTSRSSSTWAAATSRSATRSSGCSIGWAAAQRNDAEGNRLRHDAAVGQFLLVARGRGPAAEVDGRARQLAAAAHRPARADRRQAPGNQQGHRQRAGRAKSPSGYRPSWWTSTSSSWSRSTTARSHRATASCGPT